MAVNEDDCIKRIVKSYLHFKGEATTAMIVQHMIAVDYGLRKTCTPRSLGMKLSVWNQHSKSGSWFKLESFERDKKRWWRLR